MKKFDFVIGNPPYQDNTLGENESYAPPVYNQFMNESYKLADKIELIHPARFLFGAGGTPKEWNSKMINSEHFKVLYYEQDSSKIFANTDIMGGIAVSYYSNNEKFDPIRVFTPFTELNSIMRKVANYGTVDNMSKMFSLQNKFNLEALYKDYPEYTKIIGSDGKDKRFRNNIFEKVSLFSENRNGIDDVEIVGILKNKRVRRYISRKYIEKGHKTLDKWKVLIPSNNGSPALGDKPTAIIGKPIEIEPGIGYTQTFLSVGPLSNKEEAQAMCKYISTKFARCLLGILKVTPNNPPDKWIYVPIQDFSDSSDIDWKKSIHEIDLQLYKKYKLTDEEISFIENHVKEME